MTQAEIQAMAAEIAALKAANAQLIASQPKPSDRTALGENLFVKISEKGAVSVYGLTTRFPVTLYYGQWIRLLAVVDSLRAYIEANKSKLAMKAKED